MTLAWRWAGACAIGTSHVRTNLECQDRAACLVVNTGLGPVTAAVISDGAGSAPAAAQGASIVCMEFNRRATSYLRAGGALTKIDDELAADWIDSIREKIYLAASIARLKPRDYAATLVALLASGEHCTVVHIGDGAVVVRERETQEWAVQSWPFHGEYASTTRFVTDDPVARYKLVHLGSAIDRFAIFSDGIENLVLDYRQRSAPGALFEQLLKPLVTWEGVGRNRLLSGQLRDYLGSKKICDATDDDKSLILGACL